MNREIKFRAWDKEQKYMFEIFDNNSGNWFLPKWKDRYEVMQYTGLKDKNGVEIYEGDIFEVLNSYEKRFKVWVEYCEKYAQFVIRSSSFIYDYEPLGDLRGKDIEVIGNVTDNPELLEE